MDYIFKRSRVTFAAFYSAFPFPSPDVVVVLFCFFSLFLSSFLLAKSNPQESMPPPPPARCLRTQSPSAMEGGREGAWHGSSQALRTNTSLPPSPRPSVCLSWTDECSYTFCFLRSPGRRFPLLPSKKSHPSSKLSIVATWQNHFWISNYGLAA